MREAGKAQRGMRDAVPRGMKPVFLLAFLALGPALANLVPAARPLVDPATGDAMSETQHPAAVSSLVPLEVERNWLCGR